MPAIEGELLEECGGLEELADIVAEVTSLILELVNGYANLYSLCLLDVAEDFLIHCTLLDKLHEGVKKELVGVRSLLLIRLELLLELSGNRDFLGLEKALEEHVDSVVDVI